MSFIVKRLVNGHMYAYRVKSVWNPKKKISEQKTLEYIGPMDKNGKVKEKKYTPMAVVDYGNVMAVKHVFDKTLIPKVIEKLPFEEKEKKLIEFMSLNRVISPEPDYILEDWIKGNYLKYLYDINLDSRRISEMLKKIGRKDIADIYFNAVCELCKPRNVVAYDITTIPTSVDLVFSEWGRHGNGKDKIVKLAFLFEHERKLPLYFRMITGNVSDVSTLTELIKTMRETVKKASFCLVLDRGFFSDNNLKMMLETKKSNMKKLDFIIPVPRTTSLFYKSIKKIMNVKNQFLFNEKYMYGIKIKYKSMYLYVFYSPEKVAIDIDKINRKFKKIDVEEFNKKLHSAGYIIILSTKDIKPKMIMNDYYLRYYLEKSYHFLKSKDDADPFRHHSQETVMAHIFISVLSLALRWIMHEKLEEKYSIHHALLILQRIKAKVYKNGMFPTEIGKEEREILKMLDVDIVSKNTGI